MGSQSDWFGKRICYQTGVIEVAKSFNPVASPIADLGEVFVEWIGEDAFGIDQRGVTRNANKMQAGAYDVVLTN